MERILIIGPCGAGKSTAARSLGEKLGLPVIHLDQIYWRPGWVETPPDEFAPILEAALHGERWIIDGNYGGSMPLRMAHADSVIYLDFPILLCLWRTIKRIWRYRGQTRPDMSADCPERLDLSFLFYIATWRLTKRARMTRLTTEFPGTLHVFTRPSRLRKWIDGL